MKLAWAFGSWNIVNEVVWLKFVEGKIFNATDAIGFYFLPDVCVDQGWPLVVVKHVVPDGNIGNADTILEGWTRADIWCISGALFLFSLIATYVTARVSWTRHPEVLFLLDFPYGVLVVLGIIYKVTIG